MLATSATNSYEAKNRERLKTLGLEREMHEAYQGYGITNADRKAGGFRPGGWRIKLSNIWFDSLETLQAEIDRMEAEDDPIIRAGRQEELH